MAILRSADVTSLVRTCLVAILCLGWGHASVGADEPTIVRSGDELVVSIPELDRLRQRHPRLRAIVQLSGPGGARTRTIELSQRPNAMGLVFELSGLGVCDEVKLDVQNERGESVASRTVRPVPEVTIAGAASPAGAALAAIERGSQWVGPTPQITLPEVSSLRREALAAPARSVTSSSITYPVVAAVDLPALSSANAVIISRQSAAPDDANRASLYFSYRKALFDPATAKLKEYRKMLVEAPLDRAWLAGSDDATITLPLDGFKIHTTEELERDGQRWNAPQGYNMLGGSSTGLYQGGATVDVDPLGRIYITNVPDGAGIVRFNPHTNRFEQPPINFQAECRKFLPTDGDWKRGWDTDLPQVVCTRGRVYLVFDRHYRVITPNGRFETCSGVVSIPQEGWDDAASFRRDIRFHAGCWPGAKPSLYSDDVAVGAPRRAGPPIETTTGIAFGTWRLDLDDRGETQRLAVVKSLADTVAADGTSLPPTQVVKLNGLPRMRLHNVGAAGRQLLTFSYGEFQLTRAALGLTLPGATEDQLVDAKGQYRTTYPDAPSGTLTVRFDIAGKIQSEPQRFATLAASLAGVAQGPNYGVIPVPGEADQAIGVCEYSYYFSKLDFGRRATDGKVFRSYLPLASDGRATSLPIHLGLGPYQLAWIEHDDALWLYSLGYTGMGRLKYAEHGRPLEAFSQELFHRRLAPSPIDGAPRDSVKDYLLIFPVGGGKLVNIGRGRPGRGGGAYSAALELFDPSTLGPSQTAAGMSRCYGLYTPMDRWIEPALDGAARQELYVASGQIRPEYLDDIADPAKRPENRDPKIFTYSVSADGQLRDLYGFALPRLSAGDAASNLALSPCRQFLVILQGAGVVHTYSLAQRRFVDGVQLEAAGQSSVQLVSFSRPSAHLWSSPNGRMFFLTARPSGAPTRLDFHEIRVAIDGRLTIVPHRSVTLDANARLQDYNGIVRCFLPDLRKQDGSFDLVLGGSLDNGGQSTVRVIDDFIEPRGSKP